MGEVWSDSVDPDFKLTLFLGATFSPSAPRLRVVIDVKQLSRLRNDGVKRIERGPTF